MTQTKAQHTPGPWHTDYGGGLGQTTVKAHRPYDRVPALHQYTVAQCHLPLTDGEYNISEAEANARLIAASPILLSELRNALHIIETRRTSYEREAGELVTDIERMRAAIARAQGKETP